MMAAITIPIMLAIVNLIFSPKVRMRTPRSNVSGVSSPKVCPKESQERAETPLVRWAIKLPSTIPAKRSRNNDHVFFPVLAISSSISVKRVLPAFLYANTRI